MHRRCLLEVDLVHLHLAVNQLVDVHHHAEPVDVHQHEAWVHVVRDAAVGARSRARVDHHTSLVLICLELVGVPSHQDVHIQLPLEHRQGVQVAPRNNLMLGSCIDLVKNMFNRKYMLDSQSQ